MPVISDIAITAASFVKSTFTLTITGVAFADNQYSGNLYVRKTGTSGSWIAADSISSWADSQVVGVFTDAIGKGLFDARIVSGDDEEAILTRAFTIPAGGVFFFFDDGYGK